MKQDPVDLYLFFRSKLNPECVYLWQKPFKNVYYNDPVWFEPRRMGHNPIETFMKNLSFSAQLSSNTYTNHSICSTCITNLDKLGFEARHITALSGHKSEATIKEYSVQCPEGKKRQMCDALLNTLHPTKKRKPTSTVTSGTAPNTTTISASDLNQIKTENFNLMEFDNPEDDAILSKFLDENEKFLNDNLPSNTTDIQTPPVHPVQTNSLTILPQNQQMQQHADKALANVTNTFNQFQPPMPIIPRMYFPGSNVTINYNIHQK